MFQTIALLWGAMYPISYVKSKSTGKLKLFHIFSVVVAVIAPIGTSLVQLEDRFKTVGAPIITCLGSNMGHVFYTLSLPISLVNTMSVFLLILATWTLLKVSCISASNPLKFYNGQPYN